MKSMKLVVVGFVLGVGLCLSTAAVAQTPTATTRFSTTSLASSVPQPEPSAQAIKCIGEVKVDGIPYAGRLTGELLAFGPPGRLGSKTFNLPNGRYWKGELPITMTAIGRYSCSISGRMIFSNGWVRPFRSESTRNYDGCDNKTGEHGIAQFACLPPRDRTMWFDACPRHGYTSSVGLTGYHTGNSCLGRCGSGCTGVGTQIYAQDCSDHDKCCRQHGGCSNPSDQYCGDEYWEADDDFIAGTWTCDPPGLLPPPSVQLTALTVQKTPAATPRQTLTEATASAQREGELSDANRMALAQRGAFNAKEDAQQVTGVFTLDGRRASVHSIAHTSGIVAVVIQAKGLRVDGSLNPTTGTIHADGHNGRMTPELRVLLQAMEERLGREGWARQGVPRAQEYAYRWVSFIAQAPVGLVFKPHTSKIGPRTTVK